MLEKIDLSVSLSKPEYRRMVRKLQRRLLELQRACSENKLATLIIFEGLGASGKGAAINKLTEKLEPRAFILHSTRAPRTHEKSLPWMRRFWQGLPIWGEMAIYDGSWYRRVLVERVEGHIDEQSWSQAFSDINRFEKTLADDRYIIIKFFLHIDKREQKKRFKKLESNPDESWRVDDEDRHRHRNYDKFVTAVEDMLERTESERSPWTIVEARNRNWARAKVLSTTVSWIEASLEERGVQVSSVAAEPADQEKKT